MCFEYQDIIKNNMRKIYLLNIVSISIYSLGKINTFIDVKGFSKKINLILLFLFHKV